MKHTTLRKSVYVAGFFFVGTTVMMAQSAVNSPELAETKLIALNTTAASFAPAVASSVPKFQPQPQAAGNDGASSPMIPPRSMPVQTSDLLKSLPPPGAPALAAPQNQTSDGNRGHSRPWLTTGPDALSAAARIDPSFDPPSSRYGAAPAAVQFHFGKK
jgi:hypothetical protein